MIRARLSGNFTPAQIPFFNQSDQCVQQHGDHAEDTDTHQQPVELEDLASINDHIAKPFPAADKFSDDHTHQAEPDIDFHGADDRRNTAWNDHFGERMKPVSVKCIDEHDLIGIYFGKFVVKVQDTSEDRNRHSGYNDRCAVCTEPDDEQRGEGRFWQAVQDHQIRLQDFRKLPEEPEKDGDKKAEEDHQDKTDQGFVKGYSNMTENTAVTGHFQKTQGNPGRAAENERVDQPCICCKFPKEEKGKQDGDSGNGNDPFMSAVHIQVMQLVFR